MEALVCSMQAGHSAWRLPKRNPHREAFLRATSEPRIELDMRVYAVDLNAVLHDDR
jgi:hypothetical protein